VAGTDTEVGGSGARFSKLTETDSTGPKLPSASISESAGSSHDPDPCPHSAQKSQPDSLTECPLMHSIEEVKTTLETEKLTLSEKLT
jgi:hypothetical protein